ncbi:MAG TPA: hypothetical protein PK425_02400 [Syntrophales bacterium]|jgi:hypothetical protein|nr:hypothetical protein [Syntrophales bacterium]
MTIETYQVDHVIKAYHKQSRLKGKNAASPALNLGQRYVDTVSLSSNKDQKAFDSEISYRLKDILQKART